MTSFINNFFLVFAALFPIVNPLSNIPIFIQLTAGNPPEIRHAMAREIAISGFLLLLGSMFLGSHVLGFFGITLPMVRIAGGAVIFIMGWRLLNQGDNPIEDQPREHEQCGMDRSFYPLTMPLTVGPGSMSVAITIGSRKTPGLPPLSELASHYSGALLGIIGIGITIYLAYRFAASMAKFLGDTGLEVLVRLSAFILMCIGIEIIWNGWSALTATAS